MLREVLDSCVGEINSDNLTNYTIKERIILANLLRELIKEERDKQKNLNLHKIRRKCLRQTHKEKAI
jgi:hypothetical protein